LSARLSALARRLAALVAVLVMAGAFVSGAAAISPSKATPVVTSFPVHAELTPTDPLFVDQWGLKSIGVPSAWDVTLGNHSVIVAVVDTGVWWTQPDIQANMWTNPVDGTHGYDFVDSDTNPMDIDPSGQIYHGTGVAGVIGAITDNADYVAGTAQVSIMAVRALGSNGQGTSTDTAKAIIWAADHGAKVINLSLGTNETPPVEPSEIHLAIDHAWSKGALIVAAAGNAGVGTLDYPARLPEVVSVAAIDESGRRASFSNYGPGLDLSAPGSRIVTLNGGVNQPNQPNGVHYLQGTSFSTPFVSGIAGLLLSAEPGLTNVQLWNILNMTAVQPVGSGYNPNYGWGVVNARNAIAALNQPLISVDSYPTSVSSSSTFGVTWSILGPAGMTVTGGPRPDLFEIRRRRSRGRHGSPTRQVDSLSHRAPARCTSKSSRPRMEPRSRHANIRSRPRVSRTSSTSCTSSSRRTCSTWRYSSSSSRGSSRSSRSVVPQGPVARSPARRCCIRLAITSKQPNRLSPRPWRIRLRPSPRESNRRSQVRRLRLRRPPLCSRLRR